MVVLIDSSVFIAIERRGLPPEHVVVLVGEEPAALASITASELLAGVHRAESSERRSRRGNWPGERVASRSVKH